MPELATTSNDEAAAQTEVVDHQAWGLEVPKDENSVHVMCSICANKMPKSHLEGHMKRKHADPVDQVDAIGIRREDISPDEFRNAPQMANRKQVFNMEGAPDNNVTARPSSLSSTEQLKSFAEYGKLGNPLASNHTNTVDYYTIRITEHQMKDFLEQKRIFPKDGFLYLK